MNDPIERPSATAIDLRQIQARFDSLTPRQREICLLVVSGHLSKHIAAHTHISINTVKKHRMAILDKMGANTLVDLVNMISAIQGNQAVTDEAITVPKGPLRILIVEDNAALRAAMTEALTAFGHDVTALANGKGLSAIVADGQVDIVLVDIMLGEGHTDGLSLAAELRQHSRCGIIMTTALGERSTRLQSLSDAADAYLVKPIDFGELDAVISAVARRLHRAPV
jgi:DNA-binding NarL/FixJ family response regulator